MTYRHRTPSRAALRAQHLGRLGLVADRITNGVPTEGLKLAVRICHGAGCSWEDMAKTLDRPVEEIKSWNGD